MVNGWPSRAWGLHCVSSAQALPRDAAALRSLLVEQAACEQVSLLCLGPCKHRQVGCLSGKWQRGFLPQTGGGWADKVKLREKNGLSWRPLGAFRAGSGLGLYLQSLNSVRNLRGK